MEVLLLIVDIILAFTLAFQAGQMRTLISLDKEEGRKADWKLYAFMIGDAAISLYLIISVYGMGLRRGAL